MYGWRQLTWVDVEQSFDGSNRLNMVAYKTLGLLLASASGVLYVEQQVALTVNMRSLRLNTIVLTFNYY